MQPPHTVAIDDDPFEKNDVIGDHPEVAKELLALLHAIPRPPSVSRDRPPAREGRRGGAPKAAKKGGRGRPGARDPQLGWANETRDPWVEAALD